VGGVGEDYFRIAGRYECRQKIGDGSTGPVWLARDEVREETIALRCLDEELVSDLGGFKEAARHLRITTHFRHPTTTSVFDYAPVDGVVYISMEYQRGETLRERLAMIHEGNQETLSEEFVLKIVGSIMDVLRAGAATGRAHGGIKPENIWLSDNETICLSEYGMHHLLSCYSLKASAALLRTGHYLAPEMYDKAKELDFKTDQFALGILWSELIQHSDFEQDSKRFAQHRAVIQTLTATHPEQRFPDVEALIRAVQSVSGSFLDKKSFSNPITDAQRTAHVPWKRCLILSSLLLLLIPLWQALFFQETNPLSNIREQDEIRSLVHELESDRVALFREGFRVDGLSDHVERLFAFSEFYDLLQPSNHPSKAESARTLQVMRRELESHRRRIQLGRGIVAAYVQCQDWQKSLEVTPSDEREDIAAWRQDVDRALEQCLNSLDLGQLEQALQDLDAALLTLRSETLALLESKQEEAIESRSQWKDLLEASGVPYAETPENFSFTLKSIEESKHKSETQVLAFINEVQRIRDQFDRWSVEWQMLPQAPEPTFQNSLGMLFVPVGDMQVSIWETRLIDFFHFVEESGFDANRSWREEAMYGTPAHPVATVTRYDAAKFCEWLTEKERASGLIPDDAFYSLPTDLEWSRLAGLENETGDWPMDRHLNAPGLLPWEGDPEDYSNHGNYFTPPTANETNGFLGVKDRYHRTAPVGQFLPNRFGLYDVGGNVMEWVSTEHRDGSANWPAPFYTIRGGGWRQLNPERMRVGYRINAPAGLIESGFRCVLKNGKEKP
jgi:serine/threonine protein kinase